MKITLSEKLPEQMYNFSQVYRSLENKSRDSELLQRCPSWARDETAQHRLSIGVFSYVDLTLSNAADGSWSVAWQVQQGRLLAMKGRCQSEEMAAVQLPYNVRACHRLYVPGLNAERHLVELGCVATASDRDGP